MTQNQEVLTGVAASVVDESAPSNDIVEDARIIIDAAQSQAQHAVNALLVRRNWLLGKRIAEESMASSGKDAYGKEIIANLAKRVTNMYGKGFTKSNLYSFVNFYKCFPEIFHAVSGKSSNLLSWTHYRSLLQVVDAKERNWYANEACQSRMEHAHVATQHCHSVLRQASEHEKYRCSAESRINEPWQTRKRSPSLEFMKNPVVAEFLGISAQEPLREATLEDAIISNLQKFLMEMGKGYAFVARQQRIQADDHDYFVDLVFYNYILKCFVLIDLKVR